MECKSLKSNRLPRNLSMSLRHRTVSVLRGDLFFVDLCQFSRKSEDDDCILCYGRLNVLMESKGGKKKSSSNSLQYEVPLGYSIEDVRPHGGVKKFQSAAYSNCARKPS
ncbi:hypothetical protein IEQ34_012345 [Dendrobium chrysotoxum]|uniref:Uncharacterized protein n=2 Tax=Dendrobium TaxID=37818 RepID=A0AAV7GU93_DENCH|nr:hypothetical protein IEQ34_012345 [Dendrobium chrysotoxum]